MSLLSTDALLAGQLRFIRYGFMPNRLRYCGGDDNRTLFEYGIENVVDGGLQPLLKTFTGALPYLKLIARENGIADPFDARVVDAYWIGNDLLQRVEVRQLYDALKERFGKQLQGKALDLVLSKAPAGARPHHNFHVFDVHSRAGQLEHSLETMDQCRISWGEVTEVEWPRADRATETVAVGAGKARAGKRVSNHSGTADRGTRIRRRRQGRRLGLAALGLGLRSAERATARQPGALYRLPLEARQ